MSELLYSTLFSTTPPVAYWRFQTNSDDSVGTNNGTDTAITYSDDYGRYGAGAIFNGTTSKILVPDATALKQTGTISLVAWVYPTTINTTNTIIRKGFESANQNRYTMYLGSTGKLIFRIVAAAGRAETTDAALSTNVWTHVGIVCNLNGGTNATFYINGVASSSTVTDSSAATYTNVAETNQLSIGVASNSSNFFTGYIDEAAIFSSDIGATNMALLASTPPTLGAGIFF